MGDTTVEEEVVAQSSFSPGGTSSSESSPGHRLELSSATPCTDDGHRQLADDTVPCCPLRAVEPKRRKSTNYKSSRRTVART